MTRRHKKRRGFTLIELVVVFAIIGILSAILIPTFVNFVTNTKVASANSTANSLRREVDRWLLNLNNDSYGMLVASTATEELQIICEDGEWKVFKDLSNGASAWSDKSVDLQYAGATIKKSKILIDALKLNYSNFNSASFTAYLVGGRCKYLVYNPNSNEPITAFGSLKADGTLDWKYDESLFISEGVLKGGTLIGTAPAITK